MSFSAIGDQIRISPISPDEDKRVEVPVGDFANWIEFVIQREKSATVCKQVIGPSTWPTQTRIDLDYTVAKLPPSAPETWDCVGGFDSRLAEANKIIRK